MRKVLDVASELTRGNGPDHLLARHCPLGYDGGREASEMATNRRIGKNRTLVTRPLHERDLVILLHNLVTHRVTLPAGARGCIISVADEGRNFTVEFFKPRRCIAEVKATDIVPAPVQRLK
jgi:hypothetical protein